MNLPILVWLLLSTVWGTTWLFIKVGLERLPPLTFAGIRFVIALVPLLILLFLRRLRLPRNTRDWWLIVFTGLLIFSLNYGLVFWGENYIPSGLTAILYTTFPLFGLVIAHFYLPSEPMTLLKLAGILLAILGVTIIFSNQIRVDNALAIWGAGAIVVASLGTAYADVLIKMRGQHLDPLVLTIGQMAVGLVPLLFLGFVLEGNPWSYQWNSKAWIALFYLALAGSSLTFVLLYWLIQRMDVTKTQLIPLASTLIAVLLGKLILNEELNWRTTVGGTSILLGLVCTSWGHRRVRNKKKEACILNRVDQ
ncbi:MAG: DMT family transporter [bacterium]